MKRLSGFVYELEQSDIDAAAVETLNEDADIPGIRFTPVGAVWPVKFEWASRCGMQTTPSVHCQFVEGGVCTLTHDQARRLLAFLKSVEPMLIDPPRAAGEITESPFGW